MFQRPCQSIPHEILLQRPYLNSKVPITIIFNQYTTYRVKLDSFELWEVFASFFSNYGQHFNIDLYGDRSGIYYFFELGEI